MGGEEVGGHNMINMTIESCTILSRIFSKLEFIFLGWGKNICFKVQRSSISVQRSSVGCSVAQKGKA